MHPASHAPTASAATDGGATPASPAPAVRVTMQREAADEARRRAEETYRNIFENALDGIFQITPDGRVAFDVRVFLERIRASLDAPA